MKWPELYVPPWIGEGRGGDTQNPSLKYLVGGTKNPLKLRSVNTVGGQKVQNSPCFTGKISTFFISLSHLVQKIFARDHTIHNHFVIASGALQNFFSLTSFANTKFVINFVFRLAQITSLKSFPSNLCVLVVSAGEINVAFDKSIRSFWKHQLPLLAVSIQD